MRARMMRMRELQEDTQERNSKEGWQTKRVELVKINDKNLTHKTLTRKFSDLRYFLFSCNRSTLILGVKQQLFMQT